MAADLTSFARGLQLDLSAEQRKQLTDYAACVWEKKDLLNLTSVANLDEILNRHLADGLVAAAKIAHICRAHDIKNPQIADLGSGCGYIGLTIAIALPFAQVTAVESLERRCAFMNWAVWQSGIKNVKIKKERVGQNKGNSFDFVTERAMGQLPDILEICLDQVKPNGYFIAFQGENPQIQKLPPQAVLRGVESYSLPINDAKKRHLVIFGKNK